MLLPFVGLLIAIFINVAKTYESDVGLAGGMIVVAIVLLIKSGVMDMQSLARLCLLLLGWVLLPSAILLPVL